MRGRVDLAARHHALGSVATTSDTVTRFEPRKTRSTQQALWPTDFQVAAVARPRIQPDQHAGTS